MARHDVSDTHLGWDFDGRRLTWARQPCARAHVVVWDITQPPPAEPGRPCAYPELKGSRVPLGRAGRFALRVACPAGEAECGGYVHPIVRLRLRSGARRDVYLDSAVVALDPGERRTLRWRIPARDRAAVRRARRAWLRVDAARLGGIHPHSHTVTLRRRPRA